jgi:hypothetical protein
MADDYLDSDENVSAMRDTAEKIGLQTLVVKAYQSNNAGTVKALLLKALDLLGVQFPKEQK